MIPALLHQRLLVASAGSGIVNPPDWSGDIYGAFKVVSGAASTASVQFTIRADGTWAAVNQDGGAITDGAGSWRLPNGVGAGTGYEARFTPTSAGGTGDITNGAATFQALSADRAITIAKTQSVSGSSSIAYDVFVEIRKADTQVVVASGKFRVNITAEVTASGGSGGGCVEVDMLLEPGLHARDVQVGQLIDAAAYDPDRIVRLEVRAAPITPQLCWRIVTESGAAVVASESTPMTLRDGSTVYMPDMLGEDALVADARGLTWERVVECQLVGFRDVVKIDINNACYFAGETGEARIATHNTLQKN
jgi:hypothetical protein